MAKFKVGDKVIAKKDTPYTVTDNGWKGTVVAIGSGSNFKVEGKSSTGGTHGYWVESKYFDLDTGCNQRIVITTDGETTLARLYAGKNVVKSAEAKCSPNDEFDFNTGALVAFSRLIHAKFTLNEEKPAVDAKPFDMVKVEGLDWKAFKAGKIVVKVTKDNFKEFIAEARKHGFTFKDNEDFNPFGDAYDTSVRILVKICHESIDVEDNEIYIVFEDGYLRVSHFCKGKEYIW